MRFMDAHSRKDFFDNKRRALEARIDAGEVVSIEMRRLERQIEFAKDSLAKTEKAFETERKKVAERKPGLRDSEMDLLATDAVYDRKMAEINEKQFKLSQIENQNSGEALELRAEIMRDMAVALRNGVETYSSPVSLDIIVTRVQQAKRPDGKKMKVADRLDDPNFTLTGELTDYSLHDAHAVINDQIMFIAEHVHGFSSGHEGFYETGRALGKYVERAFLGMKIAGLDIAQVRKRPKYDPHRRLLEAAQALARVKDNPEALLDVLRGFSRTSPKSHESGMAEMFWLIEKVLPGMKDMTGVLARSHHIKAASAAEARKLDATYRRMRMVAEMRWRTELTLVRETLGPDRAVQLVGAKISRTQAEMQWIDRRMAEMFKLGEQFQSKDWKVATRLQNAIFEGRVLAANLPDPNNPLLAEINAETEASRIKLESLRRPLPYREMIERRLYESGAGYRRLANHREYLRDRLKSLQEGLEKENKGAEKARKLMGLDLAGRWQCESKVVPGIAAAVTATKDRVTMELELPAPLSATAKLDAERRWGAIKGVWQVFVGAGLAAAGLVEALPTEDGKEIQFTTASTSDPKLALNWSTLVCRRDKSDGTAVADRPFVTISFKPHTGDPEYGSWEGPTGATARLRRGRKVYGTSGLEPGRYLLAISLGGRTVTRPIDIKPGAVAKISLRPAYIRLIGPDSDRLTEVRLHSAGERKDVLTEFRGNRWVGVVPGKYDLELPTFYGSAWITGVDLKPGQRLDVTTITGALLIQGEPAGGDVRIRRAAVEGAGEGIWTLTGAGRTGPLPPGKYEIVWKEKGKTHRRQVTVKPGEEKRVDLR